MYVIYYYNIPLSVSLEESFSTKADLLDFIAHLLNQYGTEVIINKITYQK